MASEILLCGLALSLVGAVVAALGDAWLARSLLVYLDAVEANVAKIAEVMHSGGNFLEVTGIDLKRDRRQNRARGVKTLGWLILILGFGLQIAACLASRS